MKKVNYKIKKNREERGWDKDGNRTIKRFVEELGVVGYRHSEFLAIRKESYGIDGHWFTWEIDHIPTGYLLTGGIDKRKSAIAIADELLKSISEETLSSKDVSFVQEKVPDEVQRYLGYGLKDKYGAFFFRTLEQFKSEYL